jgi:glycerophosphoryl diester phosphodiesterase
MKRRDFEVQGHRGARGLKPENTLPSFEAALDLGVTSIETDVYLTSDGVVVLIHDPCLSRGIYRRVDGSSSPPLARRPAVSSLTLAELRGYLADGNPNRTRFPDQDDSVTPLARRFAKEHGLDPYAVPTLADLFAFAEAYAGAMGRAVRKTPAQRKQARRVIIDIEIKRQPFHPEHVGDGFDGAAPGLLEIKVLEAIRHAGVLRRSRVRSFDHRSLRAVKTLEPGLTTALLITGTAPLEPGRLTRDAGCDIYAPDFRFLDERQVRQVHAEGLRVLPWNVNDAADWQRLFDWAVDGISTDYPDRLAKWLPKP